VYLLDFITGLSSGGKKQKHFTEKKTGAPMKIVFSEERKYQNRKQGRNSGMDIEEAQEWLKGLRSMCDSLSSPDPNLWQVQTAQIDAAMMEQAYWVLKAHKEELI